MSAASITNNEFFHPSLILEAGSRAAWGVISTALSYFNIANDVGNFKASVIAAPATLLP
jgi:hypothetical protein